jgi:hypothetical protein
MGCSLVATIALALAAQLPPVVRSAPAPARVAVAPVTRPVVVSVPDIRGRDLMSAAALVAARGLRLAARPRYADIPPGQIVEQSPAAGTSVRKDVWISAIVSSGPGPYAALGPTYRGHGHHGKGHGKHKGDED